MLRNISVSVFGILTVLCLNILALKVQTLNHSNPMFLSSTQKNEQQESVISSKIVDNSYPAPSIDPTVSTTLLDNPSAKLIPEELITPLPKDVLGETQTVQMATEEATPIPTPTPKEEVVETKKLALVTKTTPRPAATPTAKPTTSPTPAPSTEPIQSTTLVLSNGGLNADKLFDMSNSYRESKGLKPFIKDERSCQLAVSRAPEIAQEINGGFMHKGLKIRALSYYNTENIISMRSEEEAFNWWINDYIHRVQIEADNKYSCVACSGNSCAQEFTNFQPK